VNLFGQRRGLRGRSEGRWPDAGGARRRMTGADQLWAGLGGGGGQAKIALSAILVCISNFFSGCQLASKFSRTNQWFNLTAYGLSKCVNKICAPSYGM